MAARWNKIVGVALWLLPFFTLYAFAWWAVGFFKATVSFGGSLLVTGCIGLGVWLFNRD